MSRRDMLRSMSSREFAEWMAFYAIEAEANDPDREPTEDELAAKMAAFAGAHRT